MRRSIICKLGLYFALTLSLFFCALYNYTRIFQPPSSAGYHRPLRIAQIVSLWVSVPPKKYGGTERVVYNLVEELIRLGHNVTLFAAPDSKTSAPLVSSDYPVFGAGKAPKNRDNFRHYILLEQVWRRRNDFDIFHFHTTDYEYTFSLWMANRTVRTIHWHLNPDFVALFKVFNQLPLVTISNNQRSFLPPECKRVRTIYHGIPANLLPFSGKPRKPGNGSTGGYLAWIGRITAYKGPDAAIEIALRTGIPLKMAVSMEYADENFWATKIKPKIDGNPGLIELVGEVDDKAKAGFLGNASALLFPIDWDEPFGLVMIEAMSTGTPVIARRRGSVPEVIEHGVTGLIYETIDEAVNAVHNIHKLDRRRVREEFEKRFTAEQMAKNYVNLYREQISQNEN